MKSIIPYDKDIKFDTKIYEITSISLEHNEENLKSEIDGNFIIKGDYKIHPISITKENFEYKTKTQIEDEIPESVPEEEYGDWIRIVSDVKCEDDEIVVEYKYVNVSVIKERPGVSNSSDSESEEENEEE